MPKLTRQEIVDQSLCKTCNHPQREEIEKLLFNKDFSMTDIATKYPPLNKQNVQHHWERHMKGNLRKRTDIILEEEAIKRVDTIKEVNGLFDSWEDLYIQLINSLNPQASDYVAKLNAARQMLNTKTQLCKLNSDLMKNDLDLRGASDVPEMVDKFKKFLKKKGKDVDVMTIEKVKPNESHSESTQPVIQSP